MGGLSMSAFRFPVFADCTVTIVKRIEIRMLRFVRIPWEHGVSFNRTVVSSYSRHDKEEGKRERR